MVPKKSLNAHQVAVYARYSSDKQNPKSIEDQVREATSLVERMNGHVARVFEDAAKSATTMVRPGMQQLLDAVHCGEVDCIVTEDLDRLSRDIADSAPLVRDLVFREVRLITINGNLDTFDEGWRLNLSLKAVLADQYNEQLRVKTRRGMRGQWERGYSTGGLPYGYRSIQEDGGRRVVIDEEEAKIVRRVFALWTHGQSLRAIAAELTADGITAPRSSRPRQKERWNHTTVRSLLRNSKYMGEWAFGKSKWMRNPATGKRTARPQNPEQILTTFYKDRQIVSEADFRAAQQRFRNSKRGSSCSQGSRRQSSPLTGILVCGQCGGTFNLEGPKGRRRFRCRNQKNGLGCSMGVTVYEAVAYEAVFGQVRRLYQRPDAVKHVQQELVRLVRERTQHADRDLAAKRKEAQKVEGRIARLVAAIADGIDESPALRSALREAEETARRIQRELEALASHTRKPIDLPRASQVFEEILNLWQAAESDPAGLRERLREVFAGKPLRCVPEGNQLRAHGRLLTPKGLLLARALNESDALEVQSVASGGCGGRI